MSNRGLIVGVSDYQNGISKLPAVAADVRELSDLLASPAGSFSPDQLTVLTDGEARKDRIVETLQNAFGSASAGDTVFVYFAGHGFVAADGAFYFIPYDCNPGNISATAIPLITIRDHFDQSPSNRVLLWLDFCHSGGIIPRSLAPPSDADAAATIARTLHVIRGQGKVIMCACTSDQKAYEDVTHGHFTKYLLKGLRGGAANSVGEVTINSLHDYIDQEIGSTQQRPMFFGNMTGRIVLMNSRSVASKPKISVPAGAEIVSNSGSWVMIGAAFFESESVRNAANGEIVARIPSNTAEDDALLRALKPEQSWRRDPVPFAHRNDALVVRVDNVESESTEKGMMWSVTLRPEAVNYGGSFATDISLSDQNRRYSADDIADLRARRILLNDPLPPDPNRKQGGLESGGSLEMMISGLNTPYKVKGCVFRRYIRLLKISRSDSWRLAGLRRFSPSRLAKFLSTSSS